MAHFGLTVTHLLGKWLFWHKRNSIYQAPVPSTCIYSGTAVLINLSWNLGQVQKPMGTEWWSIFSCGAVLWLIQVLVSVTAPEQVQSAETFFLVMMWQSTGFDEFWSWWVPKYDCISALKFPLGYSSYPLPLLFFLHFFPTCLQIWLKQLHESCFKILVK